MKTSSLYKRFKYVLFKYCKEEKLKRNQLGQAEPKAEGDELASGSRSRDIWEAVSWITRIFKEYIEALKCDVLDMVKINWGQKWGKKKIIYEVYTPLLSLLLQLGRKHSKVHIFSQFTVKLKGDCFPLAGMISRMFIMYSIHPEWEIACWPRFRKVSSKEMPWQRNTVVVF